MSEVRKVPWNQILHNTMQHRHMHVFSGYVKTLIVADFLQFWGFHCLDVESIFKTCWLTWAAWQQNKSWRFCFWSSTDDWKSFALFSVLQQTCGWHLTVSILTAPVYVALKYRSIPVSYESRSYLTRINSNGGS